MGVVAASSEMEEGPNEPKRSLVSNLALDVCLFLLAVNEGGREGRAAAVRAKMVAFV